MTRARTPLTMSIGAAAAAMLILAGCAGGGGVEPEPDREPVPASQGSSVPCSFLTDADLGVAMDWDADETEEFGGWEETDLEGGTACSWTNDEFTVTVQVLTGRQANYSAITERTEDIMVGFTATRATRDAVGGVTAVWIEAGLDYLVKVSQNPALLVDETFAELAYTAALAFENSPMNIG
jgi:hypothetical protein